MLPGVQSQEAPPFRRGKLNGGILVSKATPERSGIKMKITIKIGKKFELTISVEQAILLAVLALAS